MYCVVWQTIVWDLVCKTVLWNSIKTTAKILALGPMEAGSDSESESEPGDESKLDSEGRKSTSIGPRTSASEMDAKTKLEERALARQSFEEKMKKWWSGEDESSLAILGREYPAVPKRRKVIYNMGISDRLGANVGIHVSKARGVEVRWTWWHIYLPTVDFLGTKFFPNSAARARKQKMKNGNDNIAEWLKQKYASFGVSWGGYAPEAPHYSFSSMFALSGLPVYPVDAWKTFCEMNAKRKSREKLSKTLDSRLKQQERHSEGEYEEVMEVKVGAS